MNRPRQAAGVGQADLSLALGAPEVQDLSGAREGVRQPPPPKKRLEKMPPPLPATPSPWENPVVFEDSF